MSDIWQSIDQGLNTIGNTAIQAAGNKKSRDWAAKMNWLYYRLNSSRQDSFLQRRVKDAKAAGLHPLAALGIAPGGGGMPNMMDPGSNFSGMGQNLTRAAAAYKTPEEKQFARLKLQNAGLQNEMLKARINQINASTPSLPSPNQVLAGQGDSGVKTLPVQIPASDKGSPAKEAGAVSDYTVAVTPDGTLVPVPSSGVKERIEDNFFHEAGHFIRNNVAPNFGYTHKALTKRGYKWSHSRQGYVKRKKRKGGW